MHTLVRTAMGLIFVASAAFLPISAAADEKPAEKAAAIEKAVSSLKYKQGEILLSNGLAKLTVPPEFRYLDSQDTATVLGTLWNNPDAGGTLGMLLPADAGPMSRDCWGIVITYNESGYIKDSDAASIDYSKLLQQLKEDTAKESEQRQKQGFPTIEMVDWAEQPKYDAGSHKLYWAQHFRFAGTEETLNYNIRILGRRGVLVLNAVAGMNQLPEIKEITPKVLAMVDFQDGNRYADFKPSIDKVAEYGIAGLILGGVAAKMGFFKLLLVGILALKKFLIIGVVAIGAFIKRIFAGITGRGKGSGRT